MLKWLEHLGRRILIRVLALLLAVPRRPVEIGPAPRILVVRLDERVGNAVLLTPLLASLRKRFTAGRIDLLAHPGCAPLLALHPAVSRFIPYRKWALLAPDGPLRTPWYLRRHAYNLAIDAANPTDPSVTHAILVRLSGATHTVGPDQPGFHHLYSSPAAIAPTVGHEIDLRLSLLAGLPGKALVREPSLPPLPPVQLPRLLGEGARFVVINTGARLTTKRLEASQYGALGGLAVQVGLRPIFTYGPGEEPLADAAAAACPDGVRASATDLVALAALMAAAEAVVSCDTGPMHLAVATGTPTCGIFLSTDPDRYGYAGAPHMVVDARDGADIKVHHRAIRAWLAKRRRGAGGGDGAASPT